ncbi:MAG: GrpB family protein [Pseudoxanthomonas sp.]
MRLMQGLLERAMIQVVSHDPGWAVKFEIEANRIAKALEGSVVRTHHIGSTAIPQTKAKTIIDILLETASLEALDQKAPMLESLGYEAMGEFGIPGRRYFRLNAADGTRTHQVHAFTAGVPDVVRHVAFRDYMRAHLLVAAEYGGLKERLAAAYPHDINAYNQGKDAFVKEHEQRALLWTATAGAAPVA